MILAGLNRRPTSAVNFLMAYRGTMLCLNAVRFDGNAPAVKPTPGQRRAALKENQLVTPGGFDWRRVSVSRVFTRLASRLSVAYTGPVVKQPFINVEEKIDRFVGRRTKTPDAFQSGMKLQSLAVELHRSLKQHWATKGVYRFKTHEEADAWMNRMLARSQIQKT